MSLADLRRMFQAKESQIAGLISRRESLVAELAAVESDLVAASGTGAPAAAPVAVKRGPGRPRKAGRPAKAPRAAKVGRPKGGAAGRRGPRGDEGVHNFIRKALASSSGPMKLADVAKKVLAAGYKTTSSRFAVIVGQRLSEMKDVKKAGRGMYALRS
jgi:hypothetical protein